MRSTPEVVNPVVDRARLCTSRSHWRVERCADARIHPGNRKSDGVSAAALIQVSTLSRVCSVISNRTALWVFCCMTVARETRFHGRFLPGELALFQRSGARDCLRSFP